MEETVALIKSCIISRKGGILVGDLNDEFRNLVGEAIPYRRLGFSSLRALLRAVDGLEMTCGRFGEQMLKINDSKISHIDRLIRKQKIDYSKTRDKYYKQFTRQKSNLEYKNERKIKMAQNSSRAKKRTHPYYYNPHTFCNDNRSVSFEEKEENHHPVVIETNAFKNTDKIYEPIAKGQQLIGDDFFLQLAIRNLHLPIWRYKDSLTLHCGLCVSGQTISDCTRALKDIGTISNRVIILLGSVDIYNGATCNEMMHDMSMLLSVLQCKFHLSNSAITICTIPPLANVAVHAHKDKSLALFCFNNWIRSLADDASKRDISFKSYQVLDLFESFSNETYTTEFDWFQTQARRVSGTKHSYVLWNKRGRKQAMSLITGEEKCMEHSGSSGSLLRQ